MPPGSLLGKPPVAGHVFGRLWRCLWSDATAETGGMELCGRTPKIRGPALDGTLTRANTRERDTHVWEPVPVPPSLRQTQMGALLYAKRSFYAKRSQHKMVEGKKGGVQCQPPLKQPTFFANIACVPSLFGVAWLEPHHKNPPWASLGFAALGAVEPSSEPLLPCSRSSTR